MEIQKKKYIRPDLQIHELDKSICLALTSENTGPDEPFGAAAQSPPPAQQSSSFEENPFDENNLK